MDKRLYLLLLLAIPFVLWQTVQGEIIVDVGNILWDSGTAFRATLDHAITANRVFTFPDATTTIVGTDVAQTLTSKTINADSNTLSNIENADIKAGANIDALKIGTGVIDNTELNTLNGITAIPTTLESLTNVTNTGCATGQVIKVSGANWVCANDDVGAGGTWESLTNVTDGGCATGQVRTANAGNWVCTTIPTITTLESLTNVTDTGCATGQVRKVSGANWICADDTGYFASEYNVIIYQDGSDTVAINGTNGNEISRGTTDSTVIQAGLDACDNIKCSIYVKAGSYTLAATLDIDSDTTFQGAGVGATIFILSHTGHGITSTSDDDVTIKDFTIDCLSQGNPPGNHCIRVNLDNNIILENLEVYGAGNHNIQISNTTNTIIDKIFSHDAGIGTGILIIESNGGVISNVLTSDTFNHGIQIKNNVFTPYNWTLNNIVIKDVTGAGGHGLQIQGGEYISMNNIHVSNTNGMGINIGTASKHIVISNFVLQGGVLQASGSDGLSIRDSGTDDITAANGVIFDYNDEGVIVGAGNAGNVTISNVVAHDNGGHGFSVNTAKNTIFSNVIGYNNAASGLRVDTGTVVIVTACRMSNNALTGITLQSGSDMIVVACNLRGNVGAALTDNSGDADNVKANNIV